MNFIAGLLRPDRGDLRLFGERIKPEHYEYKRRLGLVLEKPFYIERLTGREYLQFVGEMYDLNESLVKERSSELLQVLDLEEKQDKWIESYSAGMKKKITLAAALIHDPDLLLLDEPFEGVDAVSARLIRDNLQNWVKRNKTIFLTSHRLELVHQLCDRLAIIHKGKIVLESTMQEIDRTLEKESQKAGVDFEAFFLNLIDASVSKKPLSWNK